MQHKKVIKDIQFEIGQIERLIEEYHVLLTKCKDQDPNFVELNALAMLLHSFYNGFENIFKQIARKLYKNIPRGERWHKNLLEQMTKKVENRNYQVITDDLYLALRKYLGFRHFTRHAYSFELDWEMMKDLVLPIESIKTKAIKQNRLFIEKPNKILKENNEV